ncbi:glycoside hydrolase family 15 protein [Halopelagius longus]|uniref:Glucan 1,4-alpha-glucosidase n=1 Tax=Halopelagius longus TaxID=1236180 RepID=A0A1H1A9G8_9EURY|nr:glycoside hydrolase family 15 protein [Halopelagius longus]RDI70291.1 glucoamylase [Halopelagius longus]SDQ36297.1 glucan 1,4-alpha-glucosidase [Halopelagius longus]
MRLRTALNDYKRDRGDRRFPEECPTADGAFSGHGDRLVHVGDDGSLRDYSSSLSGLYGIDRSRFGIEAGGETHWFDDLEPVRQHYYRESTLVETEYDAGEFTVHQYDLTLGRAHVTHVELRGAIPTDAHLTAFLTFAPEGRETRVGRLIHERGGPEGTQAVEVFHRDEHDYVTASTGLDDVRGQVPERFEEVLSEEAFEFPREAVLEQYEDTHLSGDIVVSAPLERAGRGAQTTLVTQLSNHRELTRERALEDLRNCALQHSTADDIRAAARERAEVSVPEHVPREGIVRSDLRALSLLTAPSGSHIAAPEFDPFYSHTGGYGYTWFRDDAELSRYLLGADDLLDLELTDSLATTARFFCETQLDDGTWPQRAWAVDGSIAPGWAHARVEGSEKPEYQADQTASVVAFLASLLRSRRGDLDSGLAREVERTIARGVEGLDDSLEDDGLPEECQNAWENMVGRFSHTAATFLQAYASVARAPVGDELADHARAQADAVFEGLDLLWDEGYEVYGLRLRGGELDSRLDSGSFALVDAVAEYDEIAEVPEETLDKLASHMDIALSDLYRESDDGEVRGLIRFEDDYWRTAEQDDEKVWSVATAWGANAAADLAVLLDSYDRGTEADAFLERAASLYELLREDGPFTTPAGYLAEQVFDDGSFDSATPLGWSHALRLHATALLHEHDALPAPKPAPSGPEHRPRWTTGEKYGVGTVADHTSEDPSRLWFTLTEGALTEVRFPRVDLMNLRTLDFLVADADDDSTYTARTHNETRRDDDADTIERTAEMVEDEALCYRHTVTETGDGRGHEWTLTVEYVTDPEHDALLADVSFESDDDNEYELYSVADTALVNTGATDRALRLGQMGTYHLVARDADAYDQRGETEPLLIDEEGEEYSVALAMTSAGRFDWATVGVAGSEHLAGLFSEGDLPTPQDGVDNENVVLVGRIGIGNRLSETLALGFAENADTAAALGEAAGALTRGYETAYRAYCDSWADFLADKELPVAVADDEELANQYRACLMTLRAVEDKTFLGAGIASPSVPWGEAVTAEEAKGYGYNFVWSRDLYQVFTVFEAVGDVQTAIDALEYIYEFQQDERGFIPQNTYLNGRTRWGGEQMDNISFPSVMAYMLAENGVEFDDVDYDYVNVKRSADYVARNGPPTAQERWEEEAGYSPSSIAAEIAGLACAASVAIDEGHDADALIWLALADDWTERVEEWCATTTGTERHEHTPYYVRVTRDGDPDAGHLRTLANNGPTLDEREIIDGGFLELTRLGIKPHDDEVIENSVREMDDTIRVDTPHGPAFYRYNGDGYGERERGDEGAPWSIESKGKGRLWPIFTGERGEYELLAGTDEGPLSPENLLRTMAGFANSGRMLAEQVWDREHATDYNWEFGEGTGAATPLAWSMAQFVRLAHGVEAGEPVETPAFVRRRYVDTDRPKPPKLQVSTRFRGDKLVVSGQTDGEVVAVKTPSETVLVEPEEGRFEVRPDIEYGENQITVAAATHRDLTAAGTNVTRFTL